MSLMRHLRSELIKFELDTRQDAERSEDPQNSKRYLRGLKEEILGEIVELFDSSGAIVNKRKLLTDLINRERKASTALGSGVAVPHVRTMQARELVLAFLKSPEGIYFDSPDDEPVHVFFAMVAPPYEDQTYLRIYRAIGKLFSSPSVAEEFMAVESEGELRKMLRQYF